VDIETISINKSNLVKVVVTIEKEGIKTKIFNRVVEKIFNQGKMTTIENSTTIKMIEEVVVVEIIIGMIEKGQEAKIGTKMIEEMTEEIKTPDLDQKKGLIFFIRIIAILIIIIIIIHYIGGISVLNLDLETETEIEEIEEEIVIEDLNLILEIEKEIEEMIETKKEVIF